MEAIGISNLRSLKHTNDIELRPLTLLLGTNSSGKSTFLRTFPLFRQSVETKTTGPILWYGDLVDFGSFTEAKRTESEEISFCFALRTPDTSDQRTLMYSAHNRVSIGSFPVKFRISLRSLSAKTYPSEYDISFLDDHINVKFSSEGRVTSIVVNGEKFDDASAPYLLLPIGQIFQLFGRPEDLERISLAGRRYSRGITLHSQESFFLRHCSTYFDGRTQQERRLAVLRMVSIGSKIDMLNQLRRLPQADEKWRRWAAQLTDNTPAFISFRNIAIIARLPRLLAYADRYLTTFYSRVRYVAPLRASAERFYRSQNLAVDEVDSKGSNLTMFLNSLRPYEQSQFEQWTMDEMGFSVRAHSEGAHVSLKLKIKGSDGYFNLADLGFGFSQILPVLTQVWHSIHARESGVEFAPGAAMEIPKVVAIEQPELHLHPRLQALIMDVIIRSIEAAKKVGIQFIFIIETHSEAIIARIGQMISTQALAKENASVLIFEKNETSGISEIRRAYYNSDGVLENWPFGFFLPDPIEPHDAH